MFENTPDAYCPVCGKPVLVSCMKRSEVSDGTCTEWYSCGSCGVRFYVETGLTAEVN